MTLPGGAEWIIILAIVMLLFGAKRLPGLASSVGESLREFRKVTKDLDDELPGPETKRPAAAPDR